MSCLHIRLPDDTVKTKNKNTEIDVHNTTQNDENLKKTMDQKMILNEINEEQIMKNEKVNDDKLALMEIEGNSLSSKDIEVNSTAENNFSGSDTTQYDLFERNDNKQKLQRIDQILGFDAEKDKKDFFSGNLEGLADGIQNMEKNKNKSKVGFENLLSLNSSISSYVPDKKFPSGKYEPNPLFSPVGRKPPLYTTESGEDQNRKYSLSHKEISMSRNRNNGNYNMGANSDGYGNRNYLIDDDVTSYQPSAPPMYPVSSSSPSPFFSPSPPSFSSPSSSSNKRQPPSYPIKSNSSSPSSSYLLDFTPSSLPRFPNTHPNSYPTLQIPNLPQQLEPTYRRNERNENENDFCNAQYEIKLREQKLALDKIEGEIGFSGTKTTEFPSFPPSNYPAEGTAIRALRIVQKKQAELNRNRDRPASPIDERRKRENETGLNSKNQFGLDFSNSIIGDKENFNIMNHSYVIPSASAPVSDRIEYLNNMKRMRQLVV